MSPNTWIIILFRTKLEHNGRIKYEGGGYVQGMILFSIYQQFPGIGTILLYV